MDGGRDGDGDGDGNGDGVRNRSRARGMGLCVGTGTGTGAGGWYVPLGWHLGAHGEVGHRLGSSSAGGTMGKQWAGRERQGIGSLVASQDDGYDIRGTGGGGYETGRGQQVLLARKLDKLVSFASYVEIGSLYFSQRGRGSREQSGRVGTRERREGRSPSPALVALNLSPCRGRGQKTRMRDGRKGCEGFRGIAGGSVQDWRIPKW